VYVLEHRGARPEKGDRFGNEGARGIAAGERFSATYAEIGAHIVRRDIVSTLRSIIDLTPEASPRLLDLVLGRGDFDPRKRPAASKPAASSQTNRPGRWPGEAAGDLDCRKYALAALERARSDMARCKPGGRGHTLNALAFDMSPFVTIGALSRREVEAVLFDAADLCGLVATDGNEECAAKIRRGLEAGATNTTKVEAKFRQIRDEIAQRTSHGHRSSPRPPEPPEPIGASGSDCAPPGPPLAKTHGSARSKSDQATDRPRWEKRKADPDDRQVPQRDRLVEIGLGAELFHFDYTGFATVEVDGRQETYKIRSRAFRHWLSLMLFQAEQRAASGEALSDAVNHLEGAAFQGESKPTYLRLAGHGGCIYVDLGDKEWTVVKISSEGWQLIPAAKAAVKFVRARGMRGLPRPETGGSLSDLMDFVNVKKEDEVLVYSWLVQCFNPQGPYPILALITRQGGGKSTTARVLRALIDPNASPIRTMPKEPRDLVVAARNSWLLGYDNISSFPEWLADGLCQISTGGGYSARELHTDDEEIVFESMRPAIVNGLGNITARPDLADRSIRIAPPAIPKTKRKAEGEFWAMFEEHRPFLLGAIFEAVAGALSRLPETRLKALPRMADFALFAVAAEPSMPVPRGSFMRAYDSNIDEMNRVAVDDNEFAAAVVKFMKVVKDHKSDVWHGEGKVDGAGRWFGSASELLANIRGQVTETVAKSKGFPTTAAVASSLLTRLEVAFEAVGIKVKRGTRDKGKDKRKVITLKIV
jgi:hypothetical protein